MRSDSTNPSTGSQGSIPSGPKDATTIPETTFDDASPLPQQIGPYRVIRLLGQGGMGQVYECEQSNPQRRIALKVIRPGLGTGAILKRFEREAAVLGRLQHPGIARIIEAGTADAGHGPQPYLAMEYVRGKPLNDFCRSKGLGVRQRMALMRLVCQAVEHAHARGVIHRDLKPANILVDEGGQPHILDFGIAGLTGPDEEHNRLTIVATGEQSLMGTLDYMSPEQAVGDARLVDARSDVYALGVILFELLTGLTPHRLTGRPLPEAARVITQDDARRLVTVDTRFRGDIDTITSKALEKEPERRYQSAAALADDIGRYLNEQPIAARPASTIYQLRKFARRNRALVAGVALAFLAISAGLVVSLVKGHEASVARGAAERAAGDLRVQLSRSEQVVRLLGGSFEAITPAAAMGRDTSLLRTVLAEAELRLDGLRDQPEVEGEMRALIGRVAQRISDFEAADRNLSRAVEISRRSSGGGPSLEAAVSLNELSDLRTRQGLPEQGLDLADQALGALPPGGEPGEAAISHLRRARALIELARWDEASAAAERAHELLGPLEGRGAETARLTVQETIAGIYMRSDRAVLAVPIFTEVAAQRATLLGADHPEHASDLGHLALALYSSRDPVAAEGVARQALDIARRTQQEGSDAVSNINNTLGLCLVDQGRFAEAIPLFEQRLAFLNAQGGADSGAVGMGLANLGSALTRSGRHTEAVPHLTAGARLAEEHYGPQTIQTGIALASLAGALRNSGAYREALEASQRARAALEAVLPPESPDRMGVSLTDAICAYEVVWAERESIDPHEADALTAEAIETLDMFVAWREGTVPPDHWAMMLVRQQVQAGIFVRLVAMRRGGDLDPDAARSVLESAASAIEAEVEPLSGFSEQIPAWSHPSVLGFGPRWLARIHALWHEIEPGAGHDALAREWQARADAITDPTPHP